MVKMKLIVLTGLMLLIFAGVASAEEALDRLAENEYDIIVTDFRLPGKDGISLIKDIKSSSMPERNA